MSDNILDVKDFGAKGDYNFTTNTGTDDTTAFRNAIAQLRRNGGGVLKIPDGVYYLPTTTPFLIDTSNSHIQGSGNATLYMPNIPADIAGIALRGQIEQAITNVTQSIARGSNQIVVADVTPFRPGDLIAIRSAENFNPDRSSISKGEFARIRSIDASNRRLVLMGSIFDDYNDVYSIYVDRILPIRNVSVSNVIVRMGGSGKRQNGIHIKYFDNASVRHVRTERIEQTGIILGMGIHFVAHQNHVLDANMPEFGVGILISGCEHGEVTQNHGEYCRHTIDISGHGTDIISRFITVDNNTAENNSSAGISTHGGTEYITVSTNYVVNCGGGIIIRGRTHTVTDNYITNVLNPAQSTEVYNAGIFLGDDGPNHTWGNGLAGTNVIIKYNQILLTTTGHGIYSTAPLINASIEGNNIVTANGKNGMHFKGNYNDRVMIRNNMIDCTKQTPGSYNFGIFFTPTTGSQKHSDIYILDNQIIRPGYSGIRIDASRVQANMSDDLVMRGNLIRESARRGIDLSVGFFKRVRIESNVMLDIDKPNTYPYDLPISYTAGSFPLTPPLLLNNYSD
ncbi:right-handed parallel beta-helix repeat-containing protein [Brevibacillus migulae]|uniref:right-handed parallel beta-helix repeat-containing protein n=1 Tax=Brevibacillus migulae TaxID=1644114 RepID=UPI00106E49CB|nr:right-handed parallel beta-helix repeat-containing protein [Brevibacillus migulae]